jgi:amino acid adenylation domain-containing protein
MQGFVPLELPKDRRRPPIQGNRGAQIQFMVPAGIEAALRSVALQHRVTLYMLLLAAFQVLLARYSGQSDICVGSPVSGRTRKETEGLIGFFVNTLVMRGDLSGNPSFSELLTRTRSTVLDALDHQDVPFEKLVEELRPERDPGRHPLVQVVFALQNAPAVDLALEGVHCERESVRNATSKFDLFLAITPKVDGLNGSFEYDVNLFDAATIRCMAEHLLALLRSVASDPGQPIGQIPISTDEERILLTERWAGTRTVYPRDATIHSLFEAKAGECPQAPALLSDAGLLTYAELNHKANILSQLICRNGPVSGRVIGLLLDRSPELIITMLAVLKSGATYMPLDPAHPQPRLHRQILDADTLLVLTTTALRDQWPGDSPQMICVDDADLPQRLEARVDAPPPVRADSPAAIMYTSGSTGQPKGAVITHRNIVRLVRGTDYVPFGPERTFLFLAPPAFDASTFEIWGALLNGGRCAIMTEQNPSLPSLARAIEQFQVDTLWLTASLFNAVIDEQPDMLKRVSWLVTGGEALSVPHVRRALELLPATRIINGYGPTETTTFACCHPLGPIVPADVLSIPIGRPLANTRCYVLDEHRQLVPVGIPGELYIGGDGVGAGYLNRPELTETCFIRSPFDTEGRLYRSGDRVRWRQDGTLEFLGRMDKQLKLRGFRIEPREIEAVLMEIPSIQQVHVMLREDRPGDKRLAAYLVGTGIQTEAVAQHLAQQLPEFMRPSALMVLPALPITRNSKVDHGALPIPQSSVPDDATARVAPRNEAEARIHEIWKHVLARDDFGVHENFFALGGHSLLAARITFRLSEAFKVDVTLRMLLEFPTVADLAERLHGQGLAIDTTEESGQDGRGAPATDALVTIVRPNKGAGWVACVGGHILESLMALPDDIGILYLGSGAIDPLLFHRLGVKGAVRQYAKEIQRLHIDGPIVAIGFSYGGLVGYALTAWLRESTGFRADCVLLEPSTPGSRTRPIRALVSRGSGFARRLVTEGPVVLARAIRRRVQPEDEPAAPEPLTEADQEWNRIGPQLRHNVARYRPRKTPSAGVHLLVGDEWTSHQLDRFRQRFTANPVIHELGDIEHHAVVDQAHFIQFWRDLLVKVLRDGAASAP